jgi:hypothetical protein
MIEWVTWLVMWVFPAVGHADAPGYCVCEWRGGEPVGGGWYLVEHFSQGEFYVRERLWEWMTSGRCEFEGDEGHVMVLKRWNYSWGNVMEPVGLGGAHCWAGIVSMP